MKDQEKLQDCIQTLKFIKDHEGKVCNRYDSDCDHIGCNSSYESWAAVCQCLERIGELKVEIIEAIQSEETGQGP